MIIKRLKLTYDRKSINDKLQITMLINIEKYVRIHQKIFRDNALINIR